MRHVTRCVHRHLRQLALLCCGMTLAVEAQAQQPAPFERELVGGSRPNVPYLTSHRFFESEWGERTLATYHPSALLRSKELPGGDDLLRAFRGDLALVAAALHPRSRGARR